MVSEKSLQMWINPNRIGSLQAIIDTDWSIAQVVVAAGQATDDLDRICRSRRIVLETASGKDEGAIWSKRPAGLLLSTGFPLIFPREVIQKVPLMVNIHPSILPKYRGKSTIVWGIVNGDAECGLTAHLIDEGADTGPILTQRRLPLSIFDTPRSLLRKILAEEPSFVLAVLKNLKNGTLIPRPQTGRDEPVLPNRKPEHSEINPSRPLLDLYNAIRASDPDRFPAYFFVDGQKVCLRLWRPDKPENESDMI